jgi:hypothetical protein
VVTRTERVLFDLGRGSVDTIPRMRPLQAKKPTTLAFRQLQQSTPVDGPLFSPITLSNPNNISKFRTPCPLHTTRLHPTGPSPPSQPPIISSQDRIRIRAAAACPDMVDRMPHNARNATHAVRAHAHGLGPRCSSDATSGSDAASARASPSRNVRRMKGRLLVGVGLVGARVFW